MGSKWSVWAHPCQQPENIPMISLQTARKQYGPQSIGVLKHYTFPNAIGKIGEFGLAEQFDDDITHIVLSGSFYFTQLQIRSPHGVTYHIESKDSINYSPGPHHLRVMQVDTPDENVLYQENNEWGLFWEGEILPTLSPEQRSKALQMRSQSDQVGGEEESDEDDFGTLPMAADPDPKTWEAEKVADFIRNIAPAPQYATYANTFVENGIDGDLLPEINEEFLLELGVEMKTHRTTILHRVNKLLN